MADENRWGSHIDRINPGDNPADIPGIWSGPHPINDARVAHRLTKHANVHGVHLPPGTVVMLLPEEVEPLKEAVEPVDPPVAAEHHSKRIALAKKLAPDAEVKTAAHADDVIAAAQERRSEGAGS